MAAFQFLAVKRKNRNAHNELSLMSLAFSGDGKTISQQLEKWEKDS